MGGPTRDTSPTALLLRSGDCVVLAGPARCCYHGVPRIFTDKPLMPALEEATAAAAKASPCQEIATQVAAFARHMRSCRINISVRAVPRPACPASIEAWDCVTSYWKRGPTCVKAALPWIPCFESRLQSRASSYAMFAHMDIKELPPADKLPQPQPYNMKLLKAPVLSGLALTAFITMMESPMGATIYSAVGPQSGITQV
ncbi:hypothetical protein QJQ45_004048 [Haematococcus lacustris]|nr:hypothetical protein QJQ45_004048 [Haematococcus lacustris]